jgi:transposase
MLKTEVWLVIRDLYSQGLSVSKISEITGHDRKTVRKYLRLKAAPEPQKRKTGSSKLDPYKDYIMEKLSEGPIPPLVSFVKSRKWALMVGRPSLKIL